MDRELELSLIERCFEHHAAGTTTSESRSAQDTDRYQCRERYELERRQVFARLPFPVAHASTLVEINAFRSLETRLGPLLLTRNASGQSRLFYNSCRHRGSILVTEDQGSAKRLTCPYHAWSYATDGSLVNVPEETSCFPGLEKSALGLLAIPCIERYGFIWACPGEEDPAAALDSHLGDMGGCLEWLGTDQLHQFDSTRRTWRANWKIVAEGGLETYHFAFAHRDTIGPHFQHNLAITDQLGPHFRVVMPTRAMETAAGLPREQRHLRDFSHVLFSLMPTDSLLLQKGHIDWIKFRPLAVDETEITITSLIPENPDELSANSARHWQRNLEFTDEVLAEDFALGEGIQRSLASGALPQLNYGRNEWALKAFNDCVDSYCQHGSNPGQ